MTHSSRDIHVNKLEVSNHNCIYGLHSFSIAAPTLTPELCKTQSTTLFKTTVKNTPIQDCVQITTVFSP